MDEILIDEKNQENIKELMKAISELQNRVQIILQTILNCNNADGKYNLSQDGTKLIRVKEEE